jgi:hypothetical protein
LILETEGYYQAFFRLASSYDLLIINPAYLTGIYHYAIFIYELKMQTQKAIDYLKQNRKLIYEKLDEVYKSYVDSYPLIDMISDTLANWVMYQRDFDQNKIVKNSSLEDEEVMLSIVNNTRDVDLNVITE